MVIVLFVVSALFGLAAIALWAALAGARLKLNRAEQLTDELLAHLADKRTVEAAELAELRLRRDEAFRS